MAPNYWSTSNHRRPKGHDLTMAVTVVVLGRWRLQIIRRRLHDVVQANVWVADRADNNLAIDDNNIRPPPTAIVSRPLHRTYAMQARFLFYNNPTFWDFGGSQGEYLNRADPFSINPTKKSEPKRHWTLDPQEVSIYDRYLLGPMGRAPQ